MSIIKFKNPVTSSQRHLIQLNLENLKKKPLLKSKVHKFLKKFGRNNSGKITTRFKSGGHKQKYRTVNFKRLKSATGIVCSVEYDPYRTANIASVFSLNQNLFFYMLAPEELKIGDIVKSGQELDSHTGFSLPITDIPVGSFIHSVSLKPEDSAKLSRAAGTFSVILDKTLNFAEIKQSSGKKVKISTKCFATLGIVSNEFSFLTKLGKAGRSRWLSKRPTVRGVAMNPIDHPHGGGEGKKSGKGKNLWGKAVKNKKTKKNYE